VVRMTPTHNPVANVAVLAGNFVQFEWYVKEYIRDSPKIEVAYFHGFSVQVGDRRFIYASDRYRIVGLPLDDVVCVGTWYENPDAIEIKNTAELYRRRPIASSPINEPLG